MKTHRFKNYSKLGVLFFTLFFVALGCQKENFEDEQNQETLKESPYNMRIISKNEIDNNSMVSEKLKKISRDKSSFLSREVQNAEYDFTINTDRSKYIESEDGSFHSYTFLIEREEDNGSVENLVLSLEPDGSYKADVVIYNFIDENQLIINTAPLENFDSSEYFGRWELVLSCTTTVTFDLSINDDCSCLGMQIFSVETSCNYQLFNTIDAGDSATGGGWNTVVWVAYNGDGSGGGGSSSNNTGNGPGTGNGVVSSILTQAEEVKLKHQTDNSLIKARIEQMRQDLNSVNKEQASDFRKISGTGLSAIYTEHQVPSSDTGFDYAKSLPVVSNSEVKLHMHHNSTNIDGGKLTTVPSVDDIVGMAKFYKDKSQINSGQSSGLGFNLSSITVTRSGLYAFRVSDEQKVLAFYNDLTDSSLVNGKGETYQKLVTNTFIEKVINRTKNQCTLTNCTDEQEAALFELNFKNFFKSLDSGLDLYVSFSTDSNGNYVWTFLTN